MPNVPVTIYTLVSLMVLKVLLADDEIKCFCDRFSCPGSLMCSGKWCLIGINADGKTRSSMEMCGASINVAVGTKSIAQWIAHKTSIVGPKSVPVMSHFVIRLRIFAHTWTNRPLYKQLTAIRIPAIRKKYTSNSELTRSRGGWYQGGNLIILLVILPLSVGGLAVCLVFVNYICKMS
ncbi:hypothetical protein M3Y98_00394400 [Aphelenchoides besseyi]|nr:hypothetical protein M3Y98_00394400 [Aphelenchoides besseyi]